jgi:Tfp pilus assembly protein PilX
MLGRLSARLRDERGVALVLALLITSALTITTAGLALLVTSNEHAFGRDRQETLAFNTAEAGLNYAVAYLAKTTDPNGDKPIGTQEPAQASYSPYSDTAPKAPLNPPHVFSNSGTPAGTFTGAWWAEKSSDHSGQSGPRARRRTTTSSGSSPPRSSRRRFRAR